MSRYGSDLSENVVVTRGNDHAVGQFVQVQDSRLPEDKDPQGEQYVVDWDSLFGFSVNLIGAELADLYDDIKLHALCDKHFGLL